MVSTKPERPGHVLGIRWKHSSRKANMIKRKTTFTLVALAGLALSTGVAYAAVNHSPTLQLTAGATIAAVRNAPAATSRSVFLEANTGTATVDLRITRDQLMYEIVWHGTTPSSVTMGGVGAPLAMAPAGLPKSVTAVEGVINLPGSRTLSALAANPARFRLTVGGATARFNQVGAVDFNRILHVGPLVSVDSGDQEVAQQKVSGGDIGAHATVFLGASMTTINYAAMWTGLTSPTALNINQGAVGAIGNLTATLFKAPNGLNPTIIAVAGSVTAPAATITALDANPAAFHTNLLTRQFPVGAVRGQLFTTMAAAPTMAPTTTTMPTMPTTPPMTTKPAPTTTMAMPAPTTTAAAPPHF